MAEGTRRLAGKIAVVTGASQGLGQYLSFELAAEGATVVLVARNRERLEAVREAIQGQGGAAVAIPANLAADADCENVISRTVNEFGAIDHLVLNAGLATYGRLDELETFAPIREAMNVNLFGAAYPTYLAVQHLIASKGLITYVTSGAGHLPMAGYLGYTTSKHAMNGFFEALRLELAPRGVDVLAINPGDMYSDDGAGRAVFGPDGDQYEVDLSVRRPNDINRTPASQVARALAPAAVDRRIYQKATRMRSAFDGLVAEHRAGRAE